MDTSSLVRAKATSIRYFLESSQELCEPGVTKKTAHNPYCSLQVVPNQLSVKQPTGSTCPCSKKHPPIKVSHQGQSVSITSGCPTYSRGGLGLPPALHTVQKLMFPSRKASARLPEGSPGSREYKQVDLLLQGLTQATVYSNCRPRSASLDKAQLHPLVMKGHF